MKGDYTIQILVQLLFEIWENTLFEVRSVRVNEYPSHSRDVKRLKTVCIAVFLEQFQPH